MELILGAAKARGYREGENPARWRGHIAQILPARSRLTRGHHKAMPYGAIPEFVGALHKRDAVAALALEFTILTAARTGEVIGAKWDDDRKSVGRGKTEAVRVDCGGSGSMKKNKKKH